MSTPTIKASKPAPTAISSISLRGIDSCDYDEKSGTVHLRIITRALTRAEEEMLSKLFPSHSEQVIKLLQRETILDSIN